MIKIREWNNEKIAEIVSDEVVISTQQDALDWMASASFDGASGIILRDDQIHPDFFDLSTKLAGDILLKFSMYRMKLAIIGAFENYPSKSLQDLIRESNRGKQFFFVADWETAVAKLTG